MTATLTEKIDSREWSGNSVKLHYILAGTSNDLTARTLLLNSTAATYNGLVRSPDVTIEPIWVDTYAGEGQWNCTVSYNAKAADIGMVTISGDTSGGTQHLVQSIANVQRYAPSGSTAPDFKGAIGVTKDSVEGVDVVCPVANYTVTKVWDAAALPNLGTIYSLTGTVNNASFSVTDSKTGLTITMAAGECLLNGVQFSAPRSDGAVEFTYSLSVSPNRTGLAVGAINGIAKKGWEYMWVRYADSDDTAAKAIIKKPVAVYIEQVYNSGTFSALGL